MGVLIKSAVPAAQTMGVRRQQLVDLLADCPALHFVQSVDNASTGYNNQFDEYELTYAGNRRLRLAYESSMTATSKSGYDGARTMKMFDGNVDAVLYTGTYTSGSPYMNPAYGVNYIKCYENDRGFIIISSNAITALPQYGQFSVVWGTDENGLRWCVIAQQNDSQDIIFTPSNIVDAATNVTGFRFYNFFQDHIQYLPPTEI